MKIEAYLKQRQILIDRAIFKYLPQASDYPQIMAKAMRYSLLVGGKRIRPILVLAAAEAVGGEIETVLPAAAAIELIHTYSLIHDDLPAMDNDDLRRGRPTSHKVFGEAMAILAGDALMTLAYEIMAGQISPKKVPPALILKAISEIGQATGFEGMVSGQAVDLASEGQKISPKTLEYIHHHKTAALLICSLRVGAILSQASGAQLKALTNFGRHLGLAFQIVDDILDVVGDAKILGKTAGKDKNSKKATFPSVFGLAQAKKMAAHEAQKAERALKIFGPRVEALKQILNFVVVRNK